MIGTITIEFTTEGAEAMPFTPSVMREWIERMVVDSSLGRKDEGDDVMINAVVDSDARVLAYVKSVKVS